MLMDRSPTYRKAANGGRTAYDAVRRAIDHTTNFHRPVWVSESVSAGLTKILSNAAGYGKVKPETSSPRLVPDSWLSRWEMHVNGQLCPDKN